LIEAVHKEGSNPAARPVQTEGSRLVGHMKVDGLTIRQKRRQHVPERISSERGQEKEDFTFRRRLMVTNSVAESAGPEEELNVSSPEAFMVAGSQK
jgi:hypothetical protein